MYDYLKGIIKNAEPTKATIEVQGVGYLVHIPLNVYSELCLKLDQIVTLFCSFVVREDSHRIFAFLSRETRDLFHTLSDVTGIGPKTATSILGHLSLDELKLALYHEDSLTLSKIPGIGPKTAARLLVELKGKVFPTSQEITPPKPGENSIFHDAISALMHLGYQQLVAQKAVKNALATQKERPTLPDLIALALKCMQKK